jgi:hypothetical protein
MTDRISNLPEADDPISPSELNMMKELFGQTASASATSSIQPKALLVYGVLFFVLNLPVIDNLMRGIIETHDLILLFIKTGVFILFILLIQTTGFVSA